MGYVRDKSFRNAYILLLRAKFRYYDNGSFVQAIKMIVSIALQSKETVVIFRTICILYLKI